MQSRDVLKARVLTALASPFRAAESFHGSDPLSG